MRLEGPNGPSMYLIDTSALAYLRRAPVAHVIGQLVADGTAATCATIDLEAAYSGREPASVSSILAARKQAYTVLELDERVGRRARAVIRILAQSGRHRAAGVVDLLTAAVAELNAATLLHYSATFEYIGEVTGLRHAWIAPRGSLESVEEGES